MKLDSLKGKVNYTINQSERLEKDISGCNAIDRARYIIIIISVDTSPLVAFIQIFVW